MSTESTYFLCAVLVGLGATLFMDVWALFLNRAFSSPLPNYCLVGRRIHVFGTVYALVLVALVSASWLARPTLLPACLRRS